jgi:arginase
MAAVDLIYCPYDSGRRDWRCGRGPTRILQQGAVARIEAAGAEVRLVEIEPGVSYESENALGFDVQRRIAEATANARKAGRLPLVLAGNCNAAVGGASGIGGSRRGVVWFDAHGDFCTPETTDTGFLDGMGLAMMVGRCWRRVLSRMPGFAPVAETATALVGARDLDPAEAEDLAGSAITYLRVEDLRARGVGGAFEPFLERLAREVDQVYLHIDLDVHDPEEVPANRLNVPDGLWASEVREAVTLIGQHVRVAGGGLGSYDPSVDPEGKTAEVAVRLLGALLAASCAR